MLDERLQALLHDLEHLPSQDQQRLADQIEEWLDTIEWARILHAPGPDALYEAALEEMRQGTTESSHQRILKGHEFTYDPVIP
ncbi:MAG: hypothetical protein IVW57_06370 [Ktedonobacterales bacterium]|nr:hypothetical protein [Ktedonobacterales bacterium]